MRAAAAWRLLIGVHSPWLVELGSSKAELEAKSLALEAKLAETQRRSRHFEARAKEALEKAQRLAKELAEARGQSQAPAEDPTEDDPASRRVSASGDQTGTPSRSATPPQGAGRPPITPSSGQSLLRTRSAASSRSESPDAAAAAARARQLEREVDRLRGEADARESRIQGLLSLAGDKGERLKVIEAEAAALRGQLAAAQAEQDAARSRQAAAGGAPPPPPSRPLARPPNASPFAPAGSPRRMP